MKNISFKKYGLSPEDVETYRKFGILPDKRTLKQLINAYNSNDKATAEHIELLENKLEFKIDAHYKDFLMTQNGGVPSKQKFKNIVVDYFLSFKSDYKFNSILDLVDDFLDKGLPIGMTPSGDFIILDKENKIYLHKHDEYPDNQLIYLCEDFCNFLNGLK